MSKDSIIYDAYCNDIGFGSIKSFLKDAREKDPSITLKDVSEWKDIHLDRTKKLKGFNSYVAPEARYEFQVDLFYYKTNQQPSWYQPPYGLLAVDSFSEYCHIVPIDRKLASHWIKAFKQIFEVMGKPKVIYSDPDSAMMATSVEKFFKSEGIDWIRTREHAAIAGRTIRTIKSELDKRMEHKPDRWVNAIPGVLEKYNNKESHSAIGMTPKEATKPENDHDVRTNLIIHSIKKRKYPELNVGDKVKIYRKRKKFDKERVPVWEDDYTTITDIKEAHGQKLYKVEGSPIPFIRSNILKINH